MTKDAVAELDQSSLREADAGPCIRLTGKRGEPQRGEMRSARRFPQDRSSRSTKEAQFHEQRAGFRREGHSVTIE